MTVSMYKVSVPIFVQFLTAQSACIDKAVAHIEAKQLDPNFFLNMRFFPDMYPYVAPGAAGLDPRRALLQRACRHRDAEHAQHREDLCRAQGAPRQGRSTTARPSSRRRSTAPRTRTSRIKLGANERKFTGQGLLLNFILPNFYFHCTTAYDLLRHCGVELGKRDFMGTPVNLEDNNEASAKWSKPTLRVQLSALGCRTAAPDFEFAHGAR